MASVPAVGYSKILTLSDVKVNVDSSGEKVQSVQVRDVLVSGFDVQGAFLHVYRFVSTRVRERFVVTFDMGQDKVRVAQFCAILFYERYCPGTEWSMDDNEVEWDTKVMELLSRFFGAP